MTKFLTTKKVFNGGPSIDWIQFRPKMKTYFIEEDCWDFIKYPDPPPLNLESVAESHFVDPKPTYEVTVTAALETRRIECNALHDLLDANILEAFGVGAERNKRQFENMASRLKSLDSIEASISTLEKKLHDLEESWLKRKEKRLLDV